MANILFDVILNKRTENRFQTFTIMQQLKIKNKLTTYKNVKRKLQNQKSTFPKNDRQDADTILNDL